MKTKIIAAAVCLVFLAGLLLLIPVEKNNNLHKKYGKLADAADTNERAKKVLDNIDEIPEGILKLYYSSNGYDDYLYNYPDHKDDYIKMQYTDEELNAEKPPRLYMADLRWCYQPMGGGYIQTNGCAAVSLTMAYLYLRNNGDIDPYKIANIAEENDAIGFWGGLNVDRIGEIAEKIGLEVKEYSYINEQNQKSSDPPEEEMKAILERGHVLFAGCRGEAFGDHAIIVSDYSDEGFIINDPANKEKSEKIWTYDELASNIGIILELS